MLWYYKIIFQISWNGKQMRQALEDILEGILIYKIEVTRKIKKQSQNQASRIVETDYKIR